MYLLGGDVQLANTNYVREDGSRFAGKSASIIESITSWTSEFT